MKEKIVVMLGTKTCAIMILLIALKVVLMSILKVIPCKGSKANTVLRLEYT